MSGAKAWKAVFTRRAENDIVEIFAFLMERDGPDSAEMILERFIEARDSLRELPDRGRIPPELERVNIRSFREIQVKPYRIIYQINKAAHDVYIHVVADGRRNFTELLKERLLGPVPGQMPLKSMHQIRIRSFILEAACLPERQQTLDKFLSFS